MKRVGVLTTSGMVRIALMGLVQLVATLAFSQPVSNLTDTQVRQFVQQAQASGLSEAQIEQLALSRGFTVADLAAMRGRINPLQVGVTTPASTTTVVRQQMGEAGNLPARQPIPAISPVFGASLFTNANLTFEPNLRLPTPRNYQLGPEDELVIDIYGNAQQTYRPKVSPEGSIRLESLAPIQVNGLTIEQAEQRIVGRLRTLYAGLNTTAAGIFAQVTLGNIRSISVTLVGQFRRPGTYTLSSLATVFNALYAAGGPAPDRGSFRAVRVYRGNRLIRTIDLYDFLLRADQSANIRLQDQDVVFVDHYRGRVELTGEVRQPGLYEVRAGETLKQVLAFAGGFSDRAYQASVTLRRPTPIDLQIITIPAGQLATFATQAGDQYAVGTILNRYQNKVQIRGAVFRPGDYALPQNSTLSQLIRSAEGLREDAFLNRATIRRLRPNLESELLSVDLGKVLRRESADITLQREDSVSITALNDLRERLTVTIQGAVNRAGTVAYFEGMTVASLIVQAGGFSEGASTSRLEVARRVISDTAGLPTMQNVRLITLAMDEQLRLNADEARFKLEPFDQVYVRTSPRYEAQKGATLTGEVPYPGGYAIRDRNERITDLINRAGGLKPAAFLRGSRFIRNGEVIAVDIQKVMDNPADRANFLLLHGDSLHIPRRPEVVRIRGEVLNPVTVDFQPARSLTDYIDGAGGFTRQAYRSRVYAVYPNGQIATTKRFLFGRRYPKPEQGMDLIIPTRPPNEEHRMSAPERVAVATGITSLAAVVLTLIRLVR